MIQSDFNETLNNNIVRDLDQHINYFFIRVLRERGCSSHKNEPTLLGNKVETLMSMTLQKIVYGMIMPFFFRNYLSEALAGVPPLESEEDVK